MPLTLQEPKGAIQGRDNNSGKTSKGKLLATTTFAALALFMTANAILFAVAPDDKKLSNDMWSGAGSIDVAVSDLRKLPARPNVVLLGSSLMMFPFWAMDKESDDKIGDIFHHHSSKTLEQEAVNQGLAKPVTYSFAIFGQMISDAYIYVNEFLKGDKQPDVIVFGIAPRDFSDYDLPAPMSTMSFKRLVGLENFWQYAPYYLPSFQDKVEFVANHACFLYGRRWRLQHEVNRAWDKAYAFLGLQTAKVENKPSENNAGFMLTGSVEERWTNSLSEYRRRYKNIGDKDLGMQMGLLKRLLQVCQERGIKVVLVNMPLTDVNRALFPEGFYANFGNQVGELAKQGNAEYLNLGASPDFEHGDFWDTTHLNHSGGHKLLAHVMPVLKKIESQK